MEALEFLVLVAPFLIMIYFACLLFIRPPRKVFWTSLLAGLLVGIVNFVVDFIAYQAHWWQYTFAAVALQRGALPVQALIADLFTQSMRTLHVPLPFYLTPILIFGSLAFLLIWRFWYGRNRWLSLLLLVGTPIFSCGLSRSTLASGSSGALLHTSNLCRRRTQYRQRIKRLSRRQQNLLDRL